MSLAVLADHMASKGRGPDSMLIHMSPREVQGLQALAEHHGGTLTINPETGLPEANFLEKLLPTIIGAGLTFFGGVPPHVAAMMVGGVETARTGDIGRGISAGFQAYGGANLTSNLSEMGSSAIGAESAAAGLTMTPELASELQIAGAGAKDALLQQQVTDRMAAATPFEKLSYGAEAFKNNPLASLKANAMPIAGAFGPAILSEMSAKKNMPQTVTKPGMITPYNYFGGQYVAGAPYQATPTRAAEGGLMGMNDGGYAPGQLDFAQRSEPVVRMASGGYAAGGQPSMAEWLDKAGISQEAREKGSPELYEAVNAYHALGSSLDPYRQEDTRDWGAVMAAENPTEALIQQNTPLYGGAGRIDLTDTGGMLVSGAGNPLTSDLSRYREFSIELDPVELKNQLDTIQTDTPIGRTRYNRINALYQQALMSQKPRRMAEGGIAGYAPGGYVPSDTDIFNYFKTPGLTDAKIAQDMATFGVSAADIARATGTQGQQADYEKRFVNTLIAPGTDASEFLTATKAVGLQNQALANAMQNAGLSQGAQYALTHADSDAGFTKGIIDAKTGKPVDLYNQIGYTAGALPGDKGGLEGLYGNINYTASGIQKLIDTGKMSVADAQNAALAEMARAGVSVADVKNATGKDFGNLFTAKAAPLTCGEGFKLSADGKSCVPDTKGVVTCGAGYKLSADGKSCVLDTVVVTPETSCPTGFHYDPVLKRCVKNVDATQNTTDTVTTPTSIVTADADTLPVGVSGNTGASIIGGGTTINPNGTITTSPVIPGIPVGGFTGMEQVRDTYEKGGGSLGVNKNLFVPKTQDELFARYKNTGGSKAAFDYLMGKTKYSPTPYTEDGQIAKSYAESVMKIPVASSSKMYIFKNGRYEVNPDYAIPTYDSKGVKSSNLTNADVKTFVDKGPSADAFYTWATTNNLSPEQIALASGKPINEISKLFTGAKDLVGEDGKIDQTKVDEKAEADFKTNFDYAAYLKANPDVQAELDAGKANFGTKDDLAAAAYEHYQRYGKAQKRPLKAAGGLLAGGGLAALTMARGGMSQQFDLGGYSDGGRLLRGPGDGVSDSIPATIGNKRPARLADGEFVVPARIVSELGNGSTEAGARKLYAMMDRVQSARRGTVGKGRVAKNSRSDKYLPA